jgi:hypothetical protein
MSRPGAMPELRPWATPMRRRRGLDGTAELAGQLPDELAFVTCAVIGATAAAGGNSSRRPPDRGRAGLARGTGRGLGDELVAQLRVHRVIRRSNVP